MLSAFLDFFYSVNKYSGLVVELLHSVILIQAQRNRDFLDVYAGLTVVLQHQNVLSIVTFCVPELIKRVDCNRIDISLCGHCHEFKRLLFFKVSLPVNHLLPAILSILHNNPLSSFLPVRERNSVHTKFKKSCVLFCTREIQALLESITLLHRLMYRIRIRKDGLRIWPTDHYSGRDRKNIKIFIFLFFPQTTL